MGLAFPDAMTVEFLTTLTPSAAGGPQWTRYLMVCVVLVLSIALLGWGAQRVFARTLKVRASQRSLQVLDVLPLGQRQRLVVVRCYDRNFLLGCGEKEVRHIAELDAQIESGAVRTVAEAPEKEVRAFRSALEAAGAPVDVPRPAEPAPANPPPQRRGILEHGKGILG